MAGAQVFRVSSIFVKFDKIRSVWPFGGIGSAAFSFRSSPRFGPGVEMCELSELSLGRELRAVWYWKRAPLRRQIRVICVVRVPPGESVRLMRLNGF
jgi:hypothetical protein